MRDLTDYKGGFDLSNSTFINQLIGGLNEKLSAIDSDLVVTSGGKKANRGNIQMTLTGQVTLENIDDKDSVDDKVHQLMDSLKNESNLLSLLTRG